MQRMPKPESLRKGWTLHEAQEQASGKARQEGLLMSEHEELRLECVHIAAAIYIATLEAGQTHNEDILGLADRLASFVLDERPAKGAH